MRLQNLWTQFNDVQEEINTLEESYEFAESIEEHDKSESRYDAQNIIHKSSSSLVNLSDSIVHPNILGNFVHLSLEPNFLSIARFKICDYVRHFVVYYLSKSRLFV